MSKLLDATPFPAAALSHAVPLTALERRLALMCLAQFGGRKPEDVRTRHEVFLAFEARGSAAHWEWETESKKPMESAAYETRHAIELTKKMMRTVKEVYEEALAAPHPVTGLSFLAGMQAYALGELVDRLEWIQTAKVDV